MQISVSCILYKTFIGNVKGLKKTEAAKSGLH